MIGEPQVNMCKDGVYIVNSARGNVLDEQALLSALRCGKIAGVALDVFQTEPPVGSELLKQKNVIATPHIAGQTQETAVEAARSIARQVIDYLKRGEIRHAVNAT